MAVKFNTAGKIIAHKFTLSRLEKASESYIGFCRACGASRKECEPDARNYPCPKCHRNLVYGAEELMLMGQVK